MNNSYFLMRHGESQANLADLIISDPKVGCAQYGLSPKGREQAQNSARDSGLGPETIIICSDFLRTQETAEVVRRVIGSETIIPEMGLRERYFGKIEGTSGHAYKTIWAQDSKDSVNSLLDAESPHHLALRLRKTMEKFENSYLDATILLVSHGDTLRFLQLEMAQRDLTEHLQVRLFEPAEIRALAELPNPA